jgi:hypothetical protein
MHTKAFADSKILLVLHTKAFADSKILLVLRLPRFVGDIPSLLPFCTLACLANSPPSHENHRALDFAQSFFVGSGRLLHSFVLLLALSIHGRATLKFWTAGLEECRTPVADTFCCLHLPISCLRPSLQTRLHYSELLASN